MCFVRIDWLLYFSLQIDQQMNKILIRRMWAIVLCCIAFHIVSGQELDKGLLSDKLISGMSYRVPLAGNAFLEEHIGSGGWISKEGLIAWKDGGLVGVYFRVQRAGIVNLKLRARATATAGSTIEVSALNKKAILEVRNQDFREFDAVEIPVDTPGYVKVNIRGLHKNDSHFAEISDLIVSGSATADGILFCNDPDFYYWARRGPSCHLNYVYPEENKTTYFYNEVTVPMGADKIGSYFMANGFAEGYFGIQVNSQTERRILFSVWSPFQTDDPKSIPQDQQIKLLKKGKNVYTGEFGNEGAGGQSYLRYDWKAGTTYRFLLRGEPDGKGNTTYSAWFYTPESGQWMLIARFLRPHTDTYLKRFHSFLENFNPEYGFLGRTVEFRNQWVYDGTWKAVHAAKFSVDNTYRAKQRVDAIGGITKAGFFLQNGGFFNVSITPGTEFITPITDKAPNIDFKNLE